MCAGVCVCMYICMWKQEVDMKCLPWSHSTLLPEAVSCWTWNLAIQMVHLVNCLSDIGIIVCHYTWPTFTEFLEIQHLVLVILWQVFYLLRYFVSPHHFAFSKPGKTIPFFSIPSWFSIKNVLKHSLYPAANKNNWVCRHTLHPYPFLTFLPIILTAVLYSF